MWPNAESLQKLYILHINLEQSIIVSYCIANLYVLLEMCEIAFFL